MKHFSTGQWIDFVNEVVSGEARQNMERHLTQGCETCNQTRTLWRHVRHVASAEKNYQPSLDTVRRSQFAFASSKLALKRKGAFRLAEMLFDSFLQPAFEGARTSGKSVRHVLYRADPYQIDLQIETSSDGNTLVVSGQVVDTRQPGLAGCNVRIAISNLHGPVEQTTTNEFGEFRKEIGASGDLELLFPGLGDKPIIITLRNPLGQLPAAST
ncbi:MAG TPA: hypothetical protein VGI46_16550 [Candidatus Acidoferrum sp.]|jgi:hypothetical protein